jgi:hypothetical protein
VPYRNRVSPAGDLLAVPERGTLMGNRGVLHDEHGRIVRRWQVRRWVTCVLSFRGRHRVVMTPNRYTHLFFLDEATALAAGHRPCAECRYADYQRWLRLWTRAHGLAEPPRAEAMDAVLHPQRIPVNGRRPTHRQPAPGLPDGAMVDLDGAPWLVHRDALLRWTAGGYRGRRPRPAGDVDMLTPPSTLAVIRAGYQPALHPSAE